MKYNIQGLCGQMDINLAYAKALVSDVDDANMALCPGPGLENHPAFTLGHISSAIGLTIKALGGTYNPNPEWEKVFKRQGPGDPRIPSTTRSDYPSKASLLNALEQEHNNLQSLLLTLAPEKLASPLSWRFSSHLPTTWDMLTYITLTHTAMHLGQLAAWRRALGLPSALNML